MIKKLKSNFKNNLEPVQTLQKTLKRRGSDIEVILLSADRYLSLCFKL